MFILEGEYGALLVDPPKNPSPTNTTNSNTNPNNTTPGEAANTTPSGSTAKVGRVLTSLMAIACLRSQTGVGPQVTSHIFGLRKAYVDGTAGNEEEVKGGKWLAGDEGGVWILESVDGIVGAVGEGGSNFGGVGAKL